MVANKEEIQRKNKFRTGYRVRVWETRATIVHQSLPGGSMVFLWWEHRALSLALRLWRSSVLSIIFATGARQPMSM